MGGAWQRSTLLNSYLAQLLALLALASAAYEGPRGYCSPFTARYLTYLPSEDVLVFHGGQGYILRPKRGCLAEMSLPKHEDRQMDDVSDEYLRTHLHAKCDYMSRQTLVPAKWSMQENRYVPSSP